MDIQAQKTDEMTSVSREKMVSIVSQLLSETSGHLNADEPSKSGSQEPIFSQIASNLGEPQPVLWRYERLDSSQLRLEFFARFNQLIWEVINGGKHNMSDLNPQPIPPRAFSLQTYVREAIDRIVLVQEVADAINPADTQRGKVVVNNKLLQLVDELCGNNIIIKIPIPRPKNDGDGKLSGIELMTAGAIIEKGAMSVVHEDLRQELRNAGAKLIETGISRM